MTNRSSPGRSRRRPAPRMSYQRPFKAHNSTEGRYGDRLRSPVCTICTRVHRASTRWRAAAPVWIGTAHPAGHRRIRRSAVEVSHDDPRGGSQPCTRLTTMTSWCRVAMPAAMLCPGSDGRTDWGDDHHAVIASLGDRFAIVRTDSTRGRSDLTPQVLARIEATLLPKVAAAEKRAYQNAVSPRLSEVGGAMAAERWSSLGLAQRRSLLTCLAPCGCCRSGGGRRTFDPTSAQIEWKQ